MIKNVLRNAQSKAVGIFVKSFVSTEIWKSIMNFNHTVLILNSVPNTLKRLQVLLQVGNWPVGCVCAGYFKQTPKRNKITKFCSVAIPSFGILLQALQRCQSCLFFFLMTTEGKGNSWTYFYFSEKTTQWILPEPANVWQIHCQKIRNRVLWRDSPVLGISAVWGPVKVFGQRSLFTSTALTPKSPGNFPLALNYNDFSKQKSICWITVKLLLTLPLQ